MKPPRPLAFHLLFQSEIDSFKNILPLRFVGEIEKITTYFDGVCKLKYGSEHFTTSGPDFDFMKAKFNWLRATLAVTIDSATQTW